MKPIRVIRLGAAEPSLLASAATALGREFRTSASVLDQTVDIAFAHHPERNQFHSTAIIEHLARTLGHPQDVVVGVTEVDLYIPILTFVFGEAQLGGRIAIVSCHRLTQEFYGLPGDRDLLVERLRKEAIHEAGHTAGLTHCDDYQCVMAATHAVEWLDLKGTAFCPQCRQAAEIPLQPTATRY
jgi:archaemetzincin